MTKTIYVCTGGCEGKVTEEQYNEGIRTCQAVTCAKHGQPFEKREIEDEVREMSDTQK